MLNKFALVVLILQLARAQSGPAPNGPRGLATGSADGDCTVTHCTACVSGTTNKCQTCDTGYTPSDDKSRCEPSSTNKSSLSTGAIAGISVAAVVVVGGLVGFLCWWFICRGKA